MSDAIEESWEVVGAVKGKVTIPPVVVAVRGAAARGARGGSGGGGNSGRGGGGGGGGGGRGAGRGGVIATPAAGLQEREDDSTKLNPKRWRIAAAAIRAEQAAEAAAKGKGAFYRRLRIRGRRGGGDIPDYGIHFL